MTPFISAIARVIWIAFGFVFVGVGIVGFVTPMMPGLVFFLLAAFCFAKGSRKFLRLLISNKYIGPQILDFKNGRGMTIESKIIAICMMMLSMFVSAFYMVETYWVKWAICITALVVVIIILKQKTKTAT